MKKAEKKEGEISPNTENSREGSSDKTELTGRARSLANLKRFEKGKSGNPKGKPKGAFSMVSVLKNLLETPVLDKDGKPMKINGRTMLYKEAVVLGLLNSGVKGNVLANTEIFNRIDGKQGAGILNSDDDLNIDEIKITFNKPKDKK